MDFDTNINTSDEEDQDTVDAYSSVHAAASAAPAPASAASALSKGEGGFYSRSNRLRATTTEDEEEDDDDDDEDALDEDDDNDNDDQVSQRIQESLLRAGTSKSRETPATSSRRSFVTASRGEKYLSTMSRPAKTSANKLSDSIHQPFTQRTLLKSLLRQSSSPKGKATLRQLREIEQAYIHLFPQWLAELQQGYALLFHGLGSKIRLLNLFAQTSLRHPIASKRVLLLDGFKADLSMTDLVAALESLLVSGDELRTNPLYSSRTAGRIDERISSILDRLGYDHTFSASRPLYILLHSFDGPALRSPRAQATIWTLANHPSIRLIASFDHIKAPLLFAPSRSATTPASIQDSSQTQQHHPVLYHHVPTFRPYTVEALASGCLSTLYTQSVFLSELHLLQNQQGGMRNASSSSRAKAAAFVLASLTQKAKDLFQMIASRQMARSDDEQVSLVQNQGQTPSLAMPYPNLFASARDAFLANNVGQMEALLRELRDHEIILSSNIAPLGQELDVTQDAPADLGQKGSEWLWINIDSLDLQALVDRLQLG